MDGSQFDSWTRRRVGLAAGGFALLLGSAGPARLEPDGAAARRRKKRKKRKPPTCAQRCPADCVWCFPRADAPALCGDGYSVAGCNPCASDNDCVDTATPYCLRHRTLRETGEVRRWDDVCPPYPVGICARVSGCSAN